MVLLAQEESLCIQNIENLIAKDHSLLILPPQLASLVSSQVLSTPSARSSVLIYVRRPLSLWILQSRKTSRGYLLNQEKLIFL